MRRNWALLRPFLSSRTSCIRSIPHSSFLIETLISAPKSIASAIPNRALATASSIFASTEIYSSSATLQCQRNLCSSSGPSNMVKVKTEEDFQSALSKAQDESMPAIFYFTAVWCGPCKFISPIIGELSPNYPHVTTYKIDIDEAGILGTLSKMDISSVPTLHFFKDGKKAAEIIGADVGRLKDTMAKLYT